jgi:hypothetical protein
MSAHQMVSHLSDSMRAALGEKYISRSTSLFKHVILKRLALWAPIPWPHGFKTRPEMDQQQGGTPPVELASDLEEFRTLLGRFCMLEGIRSRRDVWSNVEDRAPALRLSPHRSSPAAVQGIGWKEYVRLRTQISNVDL